MPGAQKQTSPISTTCTSAEWNGGAGGPKSAPSPPAAAPAHGAQQSSNASVVAREEETTSIVETWQWQAGSLSMMMTTAVFFV